MFDTKTCVFRYGAYESKFPKLIAFIIYQLTRVLIIDLH